MTGKGRITRYPNRRLRLMLMAQLLWIAVVCLLGAWWVKLVMIQADWIDILEGRLGPDAFVGAPEWLPTNKMIFWESVTFFVLLLAITALLFWLYWRDMKRAKSLEAFFASLTHELRTPLTSIRLQAESLAEGDRDEALIKRLLEDTSRLESQVERTLELARVEGGGPVFTQPVPIQSWIERAVKPWRESHSDRLSIQTDLEDLAVLADVSALQVVFKNLIENSLKHAGKESVAIQIRAIKGGSGTVEILYHDDGKGFSGSPQRLGELFQKGETSTGAGVGLYLVRVLMERMKGSARFESRDGFVARLIFQEAGSDG